MHSRKYQRGSATTAALAITGAVALSIAIFFFFTLPSCREAQDTAAAAAAAAADTVAQGVETPQNATAPKEPKPAPSIAVDFHASPAMLVGELARRLANADFTGAAELLGKDIGGGVKGLAAAFGTAGYAPAADHPPVAVGVTGDVTRWALPLRRRGTDAIDTQPERAYIDLVLRAPEAWEVRDLHYPESLQEIVDAAVPRPLSATARNEKDALIMADGFINALTTMDIVSALASCDGNSVPEEKIAGLCIVFEEGQFKLRKDKPLVATALRDDTAWVIAHVDSDKLGTGSEFGLEMRRKPVTGQNTNGAWQIVGINFGKLLDTYVAASEAGKVPFTPIKSRPGEGETLVLYFEYDDNHLLPRARRQIEIIADVLKADPSKILSITGHADALGSDAYNTSLSAARATAVKAQLVAFGVPEKQVVAAGMGEAEPWKPNRRDDGSDDPKGRRYNRRAEIYLNF